ncbi:hypothetical protein APASM_1669 [Actinosynnema pretiosum subsp. pretiosum]|nr:hypothetical protein APASM_1669 [Actinosynnema pretiosum subsp. pretiosum]
MRPAPPLGRPGVHSCGDPCTPRNHAPLRDVTRQWGRAARRGR